MDYQPKVTNTQKYEDSQGSHIVCKGKLIKIEDSIDNGKVFIIISETEEIEEGDWILDIHINHLWQPSKKFIDLINYDEDNDQFYKVLALSEHFSDKHLQAIVEGKMESGDEVLVKCYIEGKYFNMEPKFKQVIHLNQQNHITLFPAKQSLEEAIENYVNSKSASRARALSNDQIKDIEREAMRYIAEWAANNNYKGENS